MPLEAIAGTVTGLILVYAVLGIMASTLQEMVEGLFKIRAKALAARLKGDARLIQHPRNRPAQ